MDLAGSPISADVRSADDVIAFEGHYTMQPSRSTRAL